MIDRKELKALAEDYLDQCGDEYKIYASPHVWYLNVPRFIMGHLKLQMQLARLSPDGKGILGATTFRDSEIVVYDVRGNCGPKIFCRNTVIADPRLTKSTFPGKASGRYNFTVMHEAAHHIIADAGLMKIIPAVQMRDPGEKQQEEETKADILASYLLMPDRVLEYLIAIFPMWIPLPCMPPSRISAAKAVKIFVFSVLLESMISISEWKAAMIPL